MALMCVSKLTLIRGHNMTISRILFSTLAVSALAIAAPASAKIATGSNVADMTVTDSNGVQHNLSDFAGKKVVLEWTNEGCPYVKKHYKTNNMQKTQEMVMELFGFPLFLVPPVSKVIKHLQRPMLGKLAKALRQRPSYWIHQVR